LSTEQQKQWRKTAQENIRGFSKKYHKEHNPLMDKKHRGSMAELKVCSWLLEQGYEVFKNVSMYGTIDIIAVKDKEIRFIDVKMPAIVYNKDGSFFYQERYDTNKPDNIEYVYYGYQIDECWWPDGKYRRSKPTL